MKYVSVTGGVGGGGQSRPTARALRPVGERSGASEQPCEGFGIDTGRRKHGAFDRCVPAIADFCDCRVWSETSPSGTLRFVFFGLSAHVEAAHYLYDLVTIAFETETATFKSGTIYSTMIGGRNAPP